MKRYVFGLLLSLLLPQAGAETLCYFLVDPAGNVTSYRAPPYDLSYPDAAGQSSKELAKRQKGHLIISYTKAPCGSIEEIVIEDPNDLSAMLLRAGAVMNSGTPQTVPKPAVPLAGKQTQQAPAAAPVKAVGGETAVTSQAMSRVLHLMEDGIRKQNLAGLENYLASPLTLVEIKDGQGTPREFKPGEFVAYLRGQWENSQAYEMGRTNMRQTLNPDGKSATSTAELTITSQAKGDAAKQSSIYTEVIGYALIDGLTKITKMERTLKSAPPAPAGNPPANAEKPEESPATPPPGGNIAETLKP